MKHNREQDIKALKQCIDFFIYNGVELLRGKEFPVDQLPEKLKPSPERNLKAPLYFAQTTNKKKIK